MKPFNHHFGFIPLYDSRIYKDAESYDQEYYLRDFSGKEIGVFNHASSEWTWYIHGDNRFAKYIPLSDQQPGTKVSGSVPSGNFLTHSNVRIDEMTYYVFDHLGNTRLNYTVSVDNCDVDEELQLADTLYTLNYVGDYFPFGKTLREFSSTPKEKYLTTHHERDHETGLDYRGARFYDSDIGKFLSLDPMAMEYPAFSDYVYVANNPIAFVDPDGKRIIVKNARAKASLLSSLSKAGLSGAFRVNKRGVVKANRSWNKSSYGNLSSESKSLYDGMKFASSRKVGDINVTQMKGENWILGKDKLEVKGVEKIPIAGGTLSNENLAFHYEEVPIREVVTDEYVGTNSQIIPLDKSVEVVVNPSSTMQYNGTNGNSISSDPGATLIHLILDQAVPYLNGTESVVTNENLYRLRNKLPLRDGTDLGSESDYFYRPGGIIIEDGNGNELKSK